LVIDTLSDLAADEHHAEHCTEPLASARRANPDPQ
jgi:hypothetical protein